MNNDCCFVYRSFSFSQSSFSFHLIFVLYQSSFSQLDRELLVQIITLVFTWKNPVSSIEMTRARFTTTSKSRKIGKANDKADNKADDVSKICDAYSEFLWSRLRSNNHRSSQRSLLFDVLAIMRRRLLFWNLLHLLILMMIWTSLIKRWTTKWVLTLSQRQSSCSTRLELLAIEER